MILRKLTLVAIILFLFQTLRAQVIVVQGITPLPTPYTTIQAAFNSLPTTTTNNYTILIASNYDSNNEATSGVLLSNKTFNSLTIRPANNVTTVINFSKTVSNAFFNLSNVSKVTIDGRISINNNTSRFNFNSTNIVSKSVEITNGSSNNVIQYCTFNSSNNTTSSGIINISGGNNNDNIISNNSFTGTDLNFAIYHSSTGSANRTEISNNRFNNIRLSAIYAANATNGVNSWTVKGNSFFASATMNYLSSAALVHFVNAKDIKIDSNFFGGSSAYCGNQIYRAQLSNTNNNIANEFRCILFENSISGTASRITKNRFSNFEYTSSSTNQIGVKMISISGKGSFDIGAENEKNLFGNVANSSLIFNIKDNSKVVLIDNSTSGTVNIAYNEFKKLLFNDCIFSFIENNGTAGITNINNNIFNDLSKGVETNNALTNKSRNVVLSSTTSTVTINNNSVGGTYAIDALLTIFNLIKAGNVNVIDNNFDQLSNEVLTNQDLRHIHVRNSSGTVRIEKNRIINVRIETGSYKGIIVDTANQVYINENIFGGNNIGLQNAKCTILDITAFNTNTTNTSVFIQDNIVSSINAFSNLPAASSDDTLIIVRARSSIKSNVIKDIKSFRAILTYYLTAGVEFSSNSTSNIDTDEEEHTDLCIKNDNGANQPILIKDNSFYHSSTKLIFNGEVRVIKVVLQKQPSSLNIVNNLIDFTRKKNSILIGMEIENMLSTVSVLNVYFNTIQLKQDVSGTVTQGSACIKVSNLINAVVKNNIFQNLCSSTSPTNCVAEDYFALAPSSATTLNSSFNYLFVSSGNYVIRSGQSTAINFQTWSQGKNVLGGDVSVAIQEGTGMITSYFAGGGKAEPVSVITTDRLGAARSATAPWMGCYEGYQTIVGKLSTYGYCIGATMVVPFSSAGVYPTTPPTTFRVELSDASGAFLASPQYITGSASITSGSITCTLNVSGLTPGSGYRIRVVSGTAGEVSEIIGDNISIGNSPTTPTLINDQVCTNNAISLFLPPNQSYAWSRNDVAGIKPDKLIDSLKTAPAPGVTFKDSLVLNATTSSATTTYTITPYSNGCKGSSVNFTRTVIRKQFTPASLPDGFVDVQYNGPPVLLNNTSIPANNITYSGTTPPGITAKNGILSGTPTKRGTYTFDIIVSESGCISQRSYSIVIRELFNANLDFTPVLVAKSYGDDPFTIPINSRSNAPITYSIEANTAATIDATSGRVTILNALPNVTSSIWVYASQPATAVFASAKDSVRLFISRAKPRLRLISGNTYSLGNPDRLIYFISKDYPTTTAPAEPIQSDQPSIALVSADADSIYPLALGTFNVLFSFPATTNHFAFDTVIAFKVIELPIPPIAVNDTIIVIRNPDKTFTVDTINILANDTSKTGLIITKLTDIDETNIGSQYLYYKPSIGTFQYDTLNGNLIMNPYTGLQGTTLINYTLVDEDGLSSAPAQIIIIVEDLAETPPLQANEVMTPNGDGQNDALVVGYTDVSQPNSILIYDIAGNTLYEKENYRNDWTGLDNKGNPLEAGVYYYVFKESSGTQRELTGYIKIRR
ncbi:MAG: gliding motility-associated C-terminal domain-containing protein [Cytophagaceae bacterium]|jgi:gliding motility-associated-like protein|nr:gliding motility-associated C-terminal domain-containing protein [Cytophagaceae bacterium]